MKDTSTGTPESGSDSRLRGGGSRRARSIRFSDSEWEIVEGTAAKSGMNTAEFVLHAALSVANGRYGTDHGALGAAHIGLSTAARLCTVAAA